MFLKLLLTKLNKPTIIKMVTKNVTKMTKKLI